MKNATQLIIKEFPILEEHLNNRENIFLVQQSLKSLSSNVEKTFLQLAWFFEDPKQNNFNLGKLHECLEGDWLEFALDLINIYFKRDTYLIKKPTHSILLDIDDYYSQTTFAEYLNEKGFRYDQSKISAYRHRNKFPKEDIMIAGIPYWSKFSVEKYAKELENKNTNKEGF